MVTLLCDLFLVTGTDVRLTCFALVATDRPSGLTDRLFTVAQFTPQTPDLTKSLQADYLERLYCTAAYSECDGKEVFLVLIEHAFSVLSFNG